MCYRNKKLSSELNGLLIGGLYFWWRILKWMLLKPHKLTAVPWNDTWLSDHYSCSKIHIVLFQLIWQPSGSIKVWPSQVLYFGMVGPTRVKPSKTQSMRNWLCLQADADQAKAVNSKPSLRPNRYTGPDHDMPSYEHAIGAIPTSSFFT